MAAKRVVFHVGTMKSGTSFVQSVLNSQAGDLREAGVEAVGGGGRPKGRYRALPHRAAEALLGPDRDRTRWNEVVDLARDSSCETVVVSSEFFSFLRPDGIAELVESFADVELAVVLSVRDQFGAIPAQWQSFTRNRGRSSFASYTAIIREGSARRSRALRTFRRAQDVATILERWDRPGVDDLAVVTVPPSGSSPDQLWQRFTEACRMPATEPELEDAKDNQSLGYAACDYLRRLNAQLTDLGRHPYHQLVRPVARDLLAPLSGGQERPRLDRATAELAVSLNEVIRTEIESRRVRLVGALSDLPVAADLDGFPDDVAPPSAGQVRESAEVVHAHAAVQAGTPGARPPSDLASLVAETARLLRSAPE
ncbi:MAG: hypothetical protein WBP61_16250 [Nocardioides sp.]